MQFKGKEERKLDMRIVLVCRYTDTNLIISNEVGDVHVFVQQGERVWDMNAFSFLVFIVCHTEETGNMTLIVFCVCVCVFVCVYVRSSTRRSLRRNSTC